MRAVVMKKRKEDSGKTPEVKIVWDVTTGDEKIFEDRLGLIQHTAEILLRRGMTPKFAIVIHGPATAFVTKAVSKTKYSTAIYERMEKIHEVLAAMNKKGACFIQCQVPMTRNDVSEDNLFPFVEVSENIFVDLALLQRDGYSYIPIQ